MTSFIPVVRVSTRPLPSRALVVVLSLLFLAFTTAMRGVAAVEALGPGVPAHVINDTTTRSETTAAEKTRVITCLYAVTLQSPASRYFAVAPESPFTDDFRDAIARDMQALVMGSSENRSSVPDDSEEGAGPSSAVLDVFLRHDGTCTPGVAASSRLNARADTESPRPPSAVPQAATVAVVVVEKQVFGQLAWVGAQLEVTYALVDDTTTTTTTTTTTSTTTSTTTTTSSAPNPLVKTNTREVSLDTTDASTTSAPFVDLLALLTEHDGAPASSPLLHVTDTFFYDKLTRRRKNSRIQTVFVYPNLTLRDLVDAARAALPGSSMKTTGDGTDAASRPYPAALTQHLQAVYMEGTGASGCVGVSCGFAILSLVIALGLFFTAVVAFFVRLCRRRRQEATGNARLLKMEESTEPLRRRASVE